MTSPALESFTAVRIRFFYNLPADELILRVFLCARMLLNDEMRRNGRRNSRIDV